MLWYCLVCCVQATITTTRGLFLIYYHYSVIISMVRYQYCSCLYYHEIHHRRYFFWYCTLTYDDYVIFIVFYLKLSRIFDFITNIESIHWCYFWTQQFCNRQRNSLFSIFDPQQQVHISSSCYHTKKPLKCGALSEVDWSLWLRSWLRHKFPGFK